VTTTQPHRNFNVGSPRLEIPATRHQEPFVIEYKGPVELCEFFECSAEILIPDTPNICGMAMNGIEDERSGVREDLVCIPEREQSSNAPALAPFAGDFDGQLNDQFADSRGRAAEIGDNLFQHKTA
jgi:hypothetical protein